jgi:DNA-binding transcriptional LysR family regulator
MAWIFALNAECGGRETHARDLARHFDGWPARVFGDSGGGWWCGVAPEGLSRNGAHTPEEAVAMTAAGRRLYWLLRTAPPVYRYALAGIETDEFRTYDELVAEGEGLTVFPGLVVSEDIWAATGGRAEFSDFAPGYRWIPYRGETHTRG